MYMVLDSHLDEYVCLLRKMLQIPQGVTQCVNFFVDRHHLFNKVFFNKLYFNNTANHASRDTQCIIFLCSPDLFPSETLT